MTWLKEGKMSIIQSTIKAKTPEDFVASLSKNDIAQITNHIADVLTTTYVCSQFGFRYELTEVQIEIYKKSGALISSKLCFNLSQEYNDAIFTWARSNIDNYLWVYKTWTILNEKYHDLFKKDHVSYKLKTYFAVENVKIGEK
ncbi:MAG: hypothetical protein ACOYLO_00705 [Ferruginibacter sp.]